MKHLITLVITTILLLLISRPINATKLAECRGWPGSPDPFINCPDCKGYKAENVTPLGEGVEKTLWTCKGKPLNVAECAHQCVCEDNGSLTCRDWEGCSSTTVQNFCKCDWQGENKSGHCKPGSENVLAKDGGVCFCVGHGQYGSPPHDA